jgi:hypothetical protein
MPHCLKPSTLTSNVVLQISMDVVNPKDISDTTVTEMKLQENVPSSSAFIQSMNAVIMSPLGYMADLSSNKNHKTHTGLVCSTHELYTPTLSHMYYATLKNVNSGRSFKFLSTFSVYLFPWKPNILFCIKNPAVLTLQPKQKLLQRINISLE